MYYILHPFFRGGTTPGPQARPNTCAHPRAPSHCGCTRSRSDSRGCRRRCLALSVRAHRERFNGTILEFASCRLGFLLSSRACRTTCARPFSPPPFALTAAQPNPPAPLTCAACSPSTRASHAALTQPRRSHFPALSTRIPIRRPVALTWPVHTFQVRAGDPGVREDLLWFDLYVRVGLVSTVPCTSSVAAVCRGELLSAVVFSRVAGVWPMVARVCYSSVYF